MPLPAESPERALAEGARRSREASSPLAVPPLHVVVWRRYKWGIIGVGLFLLYELVLFAAGSSMGMHF